MSVAVYPGSFDPVTLGHFDIIERSAKIMDKVIVGVLNNSSKTPLFSVEERVNMLKSITKDIPNVEVMSFGGLLVDFVREQNANVIVRGLRAVTDFEYELQLSQTNHVIAPEVDTIFLTTNLFLFKFQHCKRDCQLQWRHQRVPASGDRRKGEREDGSARQIIEVRRGTYYEQN